MLPAPVIQPLRNYSAIGSKFKVGPNTYIQIRSGNCLFFSLLDRLYRNTFALFKL